MKRVRSPGAPLLPDFGRSGDFDFCDPLTRIQTHAPTWRSDASPPILCHLPIHHHRHILRRTQIPKLHYPMARARQLPPPARLLWILLNPLILRPAHRKLHRAKSPRSSPSHTQILPVDDDLTRSHHLLRHGFQNFMIQHKCTTNCGAGAPPVSRGNHRPRSMDSPSETMAHLGACARLSCAGYLPGLSHSSR
jgi:hypothetical protein